MRALVASLLIFALSNACAATGGKGNGSASPASMMQSKSSSSGGGGGGGRRYDDPRRPLPMDPSRKINEQDCSKPVDSSAGNLRCK